MPISKIKNIDGHWKTWFGGLVLWDKYDDALGWCRKYLYKVTSLKQAINYLGQEVSRTFFLYVCKILGQWQ